MYNYSPAHYLALLIFTICRQKAKNTHRKGSYWTEEWQRETTKEETEERRYVYKTTIKHSITLSSLCTMYV